MNNSHKHHSHHCIHTHDCDNPEHKKQNKQNKKIRTTKLIQKQLKPIEQQNYECSYQPSQTDHSKCLIQIHQLKISLENRQNFIKQFEQTNKKISLKQSKLMQQNKHLNAQLEYYKHEMQLLILNSKHSIQKQIKEHLQQNQQLNGKIKQHTTTIIDLKKALQMIEQRQKLFKKNAFLEKKQLKMNLSVDSRTMSKFKEVLKENQRLKEEQKIKEIKYEQIKQNYQRLNNQTQRLIKKKGKRVSQLEQQLQEIKVKNQKKINQNSQKNQLMNMEISNHSKKQENLLVKIKKIENELKKNKATETQLISKNQELEEQLKHAKNIIKKQYQINKEQQKQQKFQERSELSQIKGLGLINCKQNIIHLEKTNLQLKMRVQELEKQNVCDSDKDQIILMMGASEAFKSLIEQKNAVIKKLIKDKNQLYSKLPPNIL